jgi:hypothetical protein
MNKGGSMKDQETTRKVQIWQVIVLIEFVMIIFLGLYASYQRNALVAQVSYVTQVEQLLGNQDKREKEVSAKLLNIMTLLQKAVNDLNQGQPGAMLNNVPVPAPVPEAAK